MGALLRQTDILQTDYHVFNSVIGIHPTVSSQAKMKAFKIKDLQWPPVINNPDFPKVVAAMRLRVWYRDGGYLIPDVRDLLITPGSKTMNDLAKFIKDRHTTDPFAE